MDSIPDFIQQEANYLLLQLSGIRKRQYTYAALLYLAFRLHDMPRPLHLFGPKAAIGREYRRVLNILLRRHVISRPPPPPKAEQYVPYIVNRAELPQIVERKAIEILRAAKVKSNNPYSTAKAAVYIAARALGIYVQRDLVLRDYPYSSDSLYIQFQ